MTNTIANTILEQLGGDTFQLMTGAPHLVALVDGLLVKMPQTKHGRSHFLIITLNASDWYDVELFKLKRTTLERITIERAQDVGCQELIAVVERITGLYLTMAPRR